MGVTWARAGCLVLVMDHLGHGERRQHPFRSVADYARSFQAGLQDYYFRYDAGIQLHLVGESLVGWLAWDLMRGVDLLLAQENIDPKRIARPTARSQPLHTHRPSATPLDPCRIQRLV